MGGKPAKRDWGKDFAVHLKACEKSQDRVKDARLHSLWGAVLALREAVRDLERAQEKKV